MLEIENTDLFDTYRDEEALNNSLELSSWYPFFYFFYYPLKFILNYSGLDPFLQSEDKRDQLISESHNTNVKKDSFQDDQNSKKFEKSDKF